MGVGGGLTPDTSLEPVRDGDHLIGNSKDRVCFVLSAEGTNKQVELVWYERWESPYGLVVIYSQGCISNPGLSFNTDYPLKKGNFAYYEVSNDGVLFVYL